MSEQLDTLAELIYQWQELLSGLGRGNGRRIASKMTELFAGSRHWTEWYQRNALAAEVFDLVTDIGWSPQYRLIVYDEPPAWQKIQRLVQELHRKQEALTDNW